MPERLIVIGGTAAGLSAASKLKRLAPDLEIMVFEKTGFVSYGACGLPYYIGDLIKQPEDLVSLTEKELTEKRGILTLTHAEVTHIDKEKREVTVFFLDSQKEEVYGYTYLVIATGAIPVSPGIPGIGAEDVWHLRTVEDGIALKKKVESAKSTIIIGGGFIGLEVAGELKARGLEVFVFEQMPRLLSFLPETFSDHVTETLERKGIHVYVGIQVRAIIEEKGKARGIQTADGQMFQADFVLVSTGVKPNSLLAMDAGLKLGLKGGIAVDENMQTSDDHIWACGDCVQMYHLVTGQPVYVPLGTTANKQGRIAGENIFGIRHKFKGVLASQVTKVFDLYIGSTGLSLEQALEAGFQVEMTEVRKGDKASYYPGGRENRICLIFETHGGRLLGAQAVGSESIAGRINVLAAAITCKMTVEEISELDLVYAPPVAPVYDPVLIAASQAQKKVIS